MLLFERYRFVTEHQGWTYEAYDRTAAADLLLHKEFDALMAGLNV